MESIGILLATYNGEKYIGDLLKSLENQTFQNFICYIHDDGSNDSTVSIIKEYCYKHPKHFVMIDYPSCGGACKNFMFLLSAISEEYVMFCDQDDIWNIDKIEKQYNLIKEAEKIYGKIPICSFCDLEVVSSNMKIIAESFMEYSGFQTEDLSYKNFIFSNMAPGCAMILNKPLVNIAVKYHNIDNILMHDWWCALIAAITGKVIYSNDVLIKYRQHNNNEMGAQKNQNILDFLSRLLLSSNIRRTKKDWVISVYKQAKEVALSDEIPSNIKREFEVLSNFSNISKAKRIIEFYNYKWCYRTKRFWISLWL